MGTDWLKKYGMDDETRTKKICDLKRIELFGHALTACVVIAFVYLVFKEPPRTAYEGFLFAFSLSTTLAASFALSSSMETEIKFHELVGAVKKGDLRQDNDNRP